MKRSWLIVALGLALAPGCRSQESVPSTAVLGDELVSQAIARAGQHDGASIRDAAEIYERAEAAFRRNGEPDKAQRARLERGKLLSILGETETAVHLLESVLTRVSESEAPEFRVEVLNALAPAKRTEGKLDEAARLVEQAMQLSQQPSDPGLSNLHAGATFNRGLVEYSRGRMADALRSFQSAEQLFDEESMEAERARCQLYRGFALSNLGDEERAIAAYEQAVRLWEESNEPRGLVQTLRSLGLLHAKRGDYRLALSFFQDAERRLGPLDDPVSEAGLMMAMGQAYSDLGRPLLAIDSYDSATAKFRSSNFVQGELVAHLELGRVFASVGNLEGALEHLEVSSELQARLGTSHLEKATLGHMASAYRRMGQLETAESILERALSSSETYEDERERALHLNDLGQVHLELGALSSAESRLKASLDDSRGRYRFIEFESLFGLSRIRAEQGRLAEARETIDAALSVSEALRSRVASDAFRSSYFETVQRAHRYKVRLLLQMSGVSMAHDAGSSREARVFSHPLIRDAFEASEAVRARVLLDSLWHVGRPATRSAPRPLRTRERELRKRIETLAAQRPDRPVERDSWDQLMRAATADYDRVQGEIATLASDAESDSPDNLDDPDRRDPAGRLKAGGAIVPLASLQGDYLDERTLLLQYVLFDDASFLFSVRSSRIEAIQLSAGNELEETARKYYDLLTAPRRSSAPSAKLRALEIDKDRPEIDTLAARLYDELLAPVDLEGIERLVIAADGMLHYLPFASLRSNDAYVWERFEVVKIPSASAGVALTSRSRSDGEPYGGIAVMADPVFRLGDPRLGSSALTDAEDTESAETNLRFSRLIGTRREARAIEKLDDGSGVRLMLDFDANRDALSQPQARRSRILHLATHGFADDTHPTLSGIVLSLRDREGQPVSGYLRLPDIYGLGLENELVVLSACETALGPSASGEGIVGLVRAFLMGGSSRVLATLWRVDDTATSLFMELFYREIAEGTAPISALRRTQKQMSQHPRFGAAFYWSGFELHGDWNR